MVLGIGLAKFAPILFGLYLSREFGAATFAGFVLVLTYVSALAALPSMGATPQIIRAGAHDDPDTAVVRIIIASLLVLVLVVALSLTWWLLLAERPFLFAGASPLLVQCWIVVLAVGFVLYALAQSVCSQQGKYFAVGGYSMLIYLGAALAGVLAGWHSGAVAALTVYFIVFLVAALLFFLMSQPPLLKAWREAASALLGYEWGGALRSAFNTSLFGLITLAGLYLMMQTAQQRLSVEEGAAFALSFQLFQVGIFLPSIMGAIVVPKMVEAQQDKSGATAIPLHRRTQVIYLGIGVAWLLVVMAVAKPLLLIFGLSSNGWYGLVLLQVAAILAALQAYFIQRFVAQGRFAQLARASTLWAGTGYVSLLLVSPNLIDVVASLLFAYVVGLVYYLTCSQRGFE